VIGPPVFVGECRTHEELIGVLAERQRALNLSNEMLDDLARLTHGHVSKLLGPGRERGLSEISMNALMEALAVRLIVVEDSARVAQMKPHWEGKDLKQVRMPARIGAALIKRVRPVVLRQLASKAATARWSRIGKERRRQIMQAVSAARRHARGGVVHAPSGRCGTSEPSPGGAS
jgi:hypothetical protein